MTERKLYTNVKGYALVDEMRFFPTDTRGVLALYVNGVATGINMHVRDIGVTSDPAFFSGAGNTLELNIRAECCRLPEIKTGESTG